MLIDDGLIESQYIPNAEFYAVIKKIIMLTKKVVRNIKLEKSSEGIYCICINLKCGGGVGWVCININTQM